MLNDIEAEWVLAEQQRAGVAAPEAMRNLLKVGNQTIVDSLPPAPPPPKPPKPDPYEVAKERKARRKQDNRDAIMITLLGPAGPTIDRMALQSRAEKDRAKKRQKLIEEYGKTPEEADAVLDEYYADPDAYTLKHADEIFGSKQQSDD